MKTSNWVAIGFLGTLLGASTACSTSNDRPPPASEDTGGTVDEDTGSSTVDSALGTDSSADGSSSDGGDSTVDDSAGEGGTDGSPSDSVSDSGSDVAMTDAVLIDGFVPIDDGGKVDLVCAAIPTSGTVSALVPPSSSGDDLLASITPDALTIAWFTGTTLHVADRTTTTSAFGAGTTVGAPTLGFANTRVALSSNGLRLVFVTADGKSMRQLVRSSRTAAFIGDGDASPFSGVNSLVGDGTAKLGYPVLSSDDLVLYFATIDGTTRILRRSERGAVASSFTGSTVLSESSLTQTVPTGISSDDFTIFVWNETTGKSTAATRLKIPGAFSTVIDLGTRRYVTPSDDCSTLYYSTTVASGAGGIDLVQEN